MKTRKMKDSGVEWLGSVPEGWKIDRIGSFYTHRNEKVSDKDYPPLSVTMKGIVPQLETAAKTDDGDNRKLVRKGDFAINSRSDRRGSCGISAYEGSVSLINTILAPRGDMSPEYYNWLFHTAAFADEFYKWGHGIVDDLWTTRWTEMKRIAIAHPSLHEQRAIAAYLDKRCAKIDAMVADAKKLIEEYKAWKASLIFEAVTGKVGVDGRCRCRKMRDSGVDWIGQVPEGWVFYPIKRFFSFFKGLNITKADLTESGIPVVSYGQIHAKNNTGTHLQDELLRHVPQHYMESCPESRLKENDFVFADTSEDLEGLGNCAFVDRSDAVMAGYHTIVLRPVKNAHFKYLAYLFRADCWRRQMREIAFGIKVYSLSQRMLRQCSLVLPPLPEQRAIAAYLDRKCAAIDRVVAVKEGLIADLEAYKKSLIFECVTGKREVA